MTTIRKIIIEPTAAQAPQAHSPLPWQALDWMILCDKVNKYGNFYVAEVSPQFRVAANEEREALIECKANLDFIVRACNEYEQLLAECQRVTAECSQAIVARDQAKAHAQRLAEALSIDTITLETVVDNDPKNIAAKCCIERNREALAQWEGAK